MSNKRVNNKTSGKELLVLSKCHVCSTGTWMNIQISNKKHSRDNMAIISTYNYIEAIIARSYSFKYNTIIVIIIVFVF